MKKLFIIAVLIALITSCTRRLVDFTIISTKNVDLSKAGSFKRVGARQTGRDMTHIILSFPIGRPNLKEAIDRAIESTKGAVALVDGVVYEKGWWAILYGQSTIIVEGTPLIDPALSANFSISPYTLVKLNKDGSIQSIKELTKVEYDKLKSKVMKDSKKMTFTRLDKSNS